MTDSRARIDAWRDRRTTPLSFTLDGERYEVPRHPAEVWVLAVLSDEETDLLLDVLDDDDADYLWEGAHDPEDDLTLPMLRRIGEALLTQASGRPWYEASRLIATYADQWDTFIAVARDRGLGDPLSWPIDELCAWIYLRLTQHAKKEDVARLDATLATPPASVDPDGDDDAAPEGWDETGGWMALAAQHGGGALRT